MDRVSWGVGSQVVAPFVVEPQPGRVVFGEGALSRLPEQVELTGARRLLFVHSGRDVQAADRVRGGLGGRLAGEFTGIRPHVPVAVADAACRAAAENGADGVVCLGGGSVTGTAKAVALRTGLPIIAVPTTYAGSEVTPVWGVTSDGRKQTGTDARVLPAVVVYDPELTTGMPARLAAVTGLNALAHAVEAFWAPGRTPMTALLAAEAVRLLVQGLPQLAPGGGTGDTERSARSVTMFGSYLAGAAFAVAGPGLHHKICHVLGGTWDLSHAPTHAVVLPYVFAWNASRCAAAVRAVGVATGAGTESPHAVADSLGTLRRQLGGPGSLAELGLPEEAIAQAAALVAPVVPADNPRVTDEHGVALLLNRAWAGADPVDLVEEGDPVDEGDLVDEDDRSAVWS